ncbi:hypothetical protein B5M09_006762 [Aphanomyces astaci]|uniref:Calpain catalytic domain-containing protein n=1 Tax=Aphanomyces astaci TaxID=112090 RepID=A0A3R7XPG7_APHAT|nr:hypothetical protein B5M09_006762 [Aphanomyces astaci]
MQFEGAGITLERNVIAMLSECGDIPPMYEDPDFAAKPISLYLNPDKVPEYAVSSKRTSNGAADDSAVAWYRPGHVTADPDYFKCTAGCGVLREGTGLNDSWLVGVFAALALHPDNLIENLFVSPMHDFKTYGIYTCQFYKDCQWLEVVTDTRLPYSQSLDDVPKAANNSVSRPGHWLYGSSVDKSEVFIPLLMKAYAKFHGSGILKNHLYVVQHVKELGSLKFVKLKNVWQKGLWKGDWSNDDRFFEAALRADPACEFNRTKADGTFWMIWEDFVEAFNDSSAPGRKWLIEPDSEPSWFLNPQYRLVVAEKTSVVVSLLQRDFRVFGGDNFGVNFVLLEVKKRPVAASMVWEWDKLAVVAEGHTGTGGEKCHPEREISKGSVVLEPDVAYIFSMSRFGVLF